MLENWYEWYMVWRDGYGGYDGFNEWVEGSRYGDWKNEWCRVGKW